MCAGACVWVCICVCVYVCVCVSVYAFRIVSMDKILHFINTLIIIIITLLLSSLFLFLFQLMEFYERVSGARLHAAYVRPGGVALVS